MKTKKNFAKKLLALLAVMTMSVTAMAACAKNEEKPKDPNNSQETPDDPKQDEKVLSGFDVPDSADVAYGSEYTVPTYSVTDQNGKAYAVTYSVKNGEETIAVTEGKFTIGKITKYTITFSVEVDGKKIEKNLVLNPVDKTKPVISATKMKKRYEAGETIALPQITVTDNLDSAPTYSIVLKQGDTVKKENVTEAFSITEVGSYKLVIEAKDSAGNTEQFEIEFEVVAVRVIVLPGDSNDNGIKFEEVKAQ